MILNAAGAGNGLGFLKQFGEPAMTVWSGPGVDCDMVAGGSGGALTTSSRKISFTVGAPTPTPV